MTTIAFLGLGNMGGPMAANLVAAGHTVHGFDPVVTLRDAAAEKGAAVYTSGAEAAAGADVVITSSPTVTSSRPRTPRCCRSPRTVPC